MSQKEFKKLVIVESPAKARKISGYLGDDYIVEASVGHIRDLPQRAADIPKEVKNNEFRVSTTPAGVHALVTAGHTVFVEKNAGLGSAFTDDQYQKAGATILGSADDVWAKSEMIIKVKEPLLLECPLFRPGQVLFTYLHLAAFPDLTKTLLEKKITAIAYETTIAKDGSLPMLKPMKMAGVLIKAADNVLVRIETDEGHVGWGEAASAPQMTGETMEGMTVAVRLMASAVIGCPLSAVAEAGTRLDVAMYGNNAAKAALEMAWHDALGKATGQPVCALLGGSRRAEFIGQIFNVFGRNNLGGIGSSFQTNALSDTFGQLTTAQPRQQAELAVRFTF